MSGKKNCIVLFCVLRAISRLGYLIITFTFSYIQFSFDFENWLTLHYSFHFAPQVRQTSDGEVLDPSHTLYRGSYAGQSFFRLKRCNDKHSGITLSIFGWLFYVTSSDWCELGTSDVVETVRHALTGYLLVVIRKFIYYLCCFENVESW